MPRTASRPSALVMAALLLAAAGCGETRDSNFYILSSLPPSAAESRSPNTPRTSFKSCISDMGRGDKRTRKGKIWRGSYGNTRPKAKNDPNKYKPGDEKKEKSQS